MLDLKKKKKNKLKTNNFCEPSQKRGVFLMAFRNRVEQLMQRICPLFVNNSVHSGFRRPAETEFFNWERVTEGLAALGRVININNRAITSTFGRRTPSVKSMLFSEMELRGAGIESFLKSQ